MSKIMEIIARETNGKSYNTEKYSYDSVGVPSFDYDDSADRVMKWKESAETEVHKRAVSLVDIVSDINGRLHCLHTFLTAQDMFIKWMISLTIRRYIPLLQVKLEWDAVNE